MQLNKFPTRADLCEKPEQLNTRDLLKIPKVSFWFRKPHQLTTTCKMHSSSSNHAILYTNKLNSYFFSMHAEEHPGRDKTSIYIFPSNHTWRYYSKCYKTRIYMRMHVLFVRGYLHCSYQQVFCFPPPVPRTLLLTFRCRFTGKWEYQARSCQ